MVIIALSPPLQNENMAESYKAEEDAEEEGCLTIYWDIKNFNIFMAVEEGLLCSPLWKTVTTEGTAWWCLRVYPSDEGFEFHLFQFNGCWILDHWDINLISSCGEVPQEKKFHRVFIKRSAIVFDNRKSILPQDTLRVCCKMWQKSITTEELRFRSVLESLNFRWKIEKFVSTFCHNTFIEEDNFLLFMNLVKNNGKEKERTHKVTVENTHRKDGSFSFVHGKLSIKNDRGRTISKECFYPYVRWTCSVEIFQEGDSARDNDLHLHLESIVAVHTYQFPLSSLKLVKDSATSIEDLDSSDTLSSDLLQLFKRKTLTDATINAEGKSLPVHRSILAARSPVFCTMFEKQMSEGCSGVVDIVDIDIETVNRMLVFLYGDSLDKEMQCKEAMALYYAADKYAIQPLKVKCTNILKTNLALDNACSALVLADTHSDEQLRKWVVDFICEHPEVISSSDWNKLEEDNPLLATKCLREIFVKKEKK